LRTASGHRVDVGTQMSSSDQRRSEAYDQFSHPKPAFELKHDQRNLHFCRRAPHLRSVSTSPALALAPEHRAPEWQVAPALTPYPDAVTTMQERVAAIRAGGAADLVWLVEHPPLYTAGTSAAAADLQAPGRFPVFQTGRGGQWTYHGPGQRVAYVMLDLTRPHGALLRPRDVRSYVHALEEWLIRTLARFGVQGERREDRVGIWIADRAAGTEAKIAAIGVRITRWVSWHGVALNVAPDLEHFSGIVPCGVRAHGVTSVRALGVAATMDDVDAALRAAWREVF
jgi:lipoyl(octanoyl) transferase